MQVLKDDDYNGRLISMYDRIMHLLEGKTCPCIRSDFRNMQLLEDRSRSSMRVSCGRCSWHVELTSGALMHSVRENGITMHTNMQDEYYRQALRILNELDRQNSPVCSCIRRDTTNMIVEKNAGSMHTDVKCKMCGYHVALAEINLRTMPWIDHVDLGEIKLGNTMRHERMQKKVEDFNKAAVKLLLLGRKCDCGKYYNKDHEYFDWRVINDEEIVIICNKCKVTYHLQAREIEKLS